MNIKINKNGPLLFIEYEKTLKIIDKKKTKQKKISKLAIRI